MNQVQITLPDKMAVLTARGDHGIAIIEDERLEVYDYSRPSPALVAAYPKGCWLGALVLDIVTEPK